MSAPAIGKSVLDLSARGRLLFCGVFLGLELAGIAWGLGAPDRILAFQMFNESSRIELQLFREVERKRRRVLLSIPDGTWRAPDAAGKSRTFSWHGRVRYNPLNVLGQNVHARYGLAAQLSRLQAALEDVVRHIPDDTRTKALVAEVTATHNGRAPVVHRLRAERP